jgi:hypothetical protein
VTKVFHTTEQHDQPAEGWHWMEADIHQSPARRAQVRAMIARDVEAVRQFKI